MQTRTTFSFAESGRDRRKNLSMNNRKPKNTKIERKVMNDKFDELAKGLAQSVTRRGALKKFGLGLAGIAVASHISANRDWASPEGTC